MPVELTGVDREGLADSIGLEVKDIINTYDGAEVNSIDDLRRAIESAKRQSKDSVTIYYSRGDSLLSCAAPIGPLGVSSTPASGAFRAGSASASSSDRGRSTEEKLKAETHYGFGKVICLLISLFSILGILLSSILLITEQLGTIVAVAIIISCAISILGAQATKAVLDTADYSREILNILQTRDT